MKDSTLVNKQVHASQNLVSLVSNNVKMSTKDFHFVNTFLLLDGLNNAVWWKEMFL